MSVDYPRAWEIARAAAVEGHEDKCSFKQADGGALCDCRVLYQHPDYLDEILQTSGGEAYTGEKR